LGDFGFGNDSLADALSIGCTRQGLMGGSPVKNTYGEIGRQSGKKGRFTRAKL